ncbi:unnamed protein product, partial [Gulo gulo]
MAFILGIHLPTASQTKDIHASRMHLPTLRTCHRCPHITAVFPKAHYVQSQTSQRSHRLTPWGLHCHAHCLVHRLTKHSFNAYCVLRAVPGNGDTAMTNTD